MNYNSNSDMCVLLVTFYTSHYLFFHTTVAIKSISDTHFTSVPSMNNYFNIICISTNDWPVWLPLINQWFTNCPTFTVTVITPTRQYHNLFGINRNPNVQWSGENVSTMSNQQLLNLFANQHMCFYDGTLDTLANLHAAWFSLPFESCPKLLLALNGTHRLQSLAELVHITWSLVSHHEVGGCTTIDAWMGYTSPSSSGLDHFHAPSLQNQPHYIHMVLKDMLEFAP